MHSIYQRLVFRLTFSLVLSLLAACSPIRPSGVSSQAHAPTIPPPEHWTIEAKLGIRTPEAKGSVTLKWQQTAAGYTIRVRGPLGQGSAIITGNDQSIVIEQAGKPTLYSQNPAALIADTFGWPLPLNAFRFWLRGIAIPQQAIEASSYNAAGLMTSLQQAQWQISYSGYKKIGQWQLPGRIKANFNNTQLTLVIRQWNLL